MGFGKEWACNLESNGGVLEQPSCRKFGLVAEMGGEGSQDFCPRVKCLGTGLSSCKVDHSLSQVYLKAR